MNKLKNKLNLEIKLLIYKYLIKKKKFTTFSQFEKFIQVNGAVYNDYQLNRIYYSKGIKKQLSKTIKKKEKEDKKNEK